MHMHEQTIPLILFEREHILIITFLSLTSSLLFHSFLYAGYLSFFYDPLCIEFFVRVIWDALTVLSPHAPVL